MDHLTIDECQHRKIYRLKSRNLPIGVYNSETQSFIGIREKFGTELLDSEFHWDTGPPHGTAKPYEIVGQLEQEFQVWERYPQTTCMCCGVPVEFIRDSPEKIVGKWQHVVFHHHRPGDSFYQPWCKTVRPLSAPYTPVRLAILAVEIQLKIRKNFDDPRIPTIPWV